MLSYIDIQNIALIDKLELEFESGFVALTGETGAGKSILIDAMNLMLGGRADRDLIQSGEQRARSEGVFDLDKATETALLQLGVEAEEGRVTLSRELTASGKNTCRINGRLAGVSLLKQVGALLVNIHGQHENQILLSPERHIEFIDCCGAALTKEPKKAVEKSYNAYRALCERLSKGFSDVAEIERRADALTYQIEEIDSVGTRAGEDEELRNERALLANAEHINAMLKKASDELFGDDEDSCGAVTLCQIAAEDVKQISGIHERYADLSARLHDAMYALEEIAGDIRSSKDEAFFDPYRLEEIDARLDKLYRLKKKYGATIEEVLEFKKNAEKELEELEDARVLLERSEQEKAALRKALYDDCVTLSKARRAAAKKLEAEMLREFAELGMEKAEFEVRFAVVPSVEKAHFTENGFDEAEMMISTNPGEPVKPLHKVASGGELSRIMLAFKTIEADVFSRGTLIFDEIDAGISGRIASVVGRKLKAIAQNRQVMAVTHSAQIAALADTHYLITKTEKDGKTSTNVKRLTDDERVDAIARIISGEGQTPTATAHARELLEARKSS